jgi:hypothetical protein
MLLSSYVPVNSFRIRIQTEISLRSFGKPETVNSNFPKHARVLVAWFSQGSRRLFVNKYSNRDARS